jgi:hypothetical protein
MHTRRPGGASVTYTGGRIRSAPAAAPVRRISSPPLSRSARRATAGWRPPPTATPAPSPRGRRAPAPGPPSTGARARHLVHPLRLGPRGMQLPPAPRKRRRPRPVRLPRRRRRLLPPRLCEIRHLVLLLISSVRRGPASCTVRSRRSAGTLRQSRRRWDTQGTQIGPHETSDGGVHLRNPIRRNQLKVSNSGSAAGMPVASTPRRAARAQPHRPTRKNASHAYRSLPAVSCPAVNEYAGHGSR